MTNVVKINWKPESQQALEEYLAENNVGAFIFVAENKDANCYDYIVGEHTDRAQSVGLLEMAKEELINRGIREDD